jgi:hypothetical protein
MEITPLSVGNYGLTESQKSAIEKKLQAFSLEV